MKPVIYKLTKAALSEMRTYREASLITDIFLRAARRKNDQVNKVAVICTTFSLIAGAALGTKTDLLTGLLMTGMLMVNTGLLIAMEKAGVARYFMYHLDENDIKDVQVMRRIMKAVYPDSKDIGNISDVYTSEELIRKIESHKP